MKYVSLFAGIGGFDLALNRLGHTCVYANEWDKYATQIYEKNFCTNKEGQGQTQVAGGNNANTSGRGREWQPNVNSPRIDTRDIRTVDTDSIPDHDLLVGGFPCQSFSIAGKRGGFKDTRGTLFFEITRIAKAKRTPYLLLENVKGLLSHDNGKTFSTIISSLDELGYDLQWQVLNSKNHGVPQNRERVFIIGNLRGKPRPKVFPIGENSQADIVLPTLTARYWGGQANGGYIDNKQKSELNYIGGIISERDMWLKDGKQYSRNFSQGQRVYGTDGIASTLRSRTGIYKTGMKIRRLTPLEAERLQGFPDNWTQGISDTQRYKCLGNAVTVNVIQAIASKFPNCPLGHDCTSDCRRNGCPCDDHDHNLKGQYPIKNYPAENSG